MSVSHNCLCQTILRRSFKKQLGANVLSPDGMTIHGTILQQCLPSFMIKFLSSRVPIVIKLFALPSATPSRINVPSLCGGDFECTESFYFDEVSVLVFLI